MAQNQSSHMSPKSTPNDFWVLLTCSGTKITPSSAMKQILVKVEIFTIFGVRQVDNLSDLKNGQFLNIMKMA